MNTMRLLLLFKKKKTDFSSNNPRQFCKSWQEKEEERQIFNLINISVITLKMATFICR